MDVLRRLIQDERILYFMLDEANPAKRRPLRELIDEINIRPRTSEPERQKMQIVMAFYREMSDFLQAGLPKQINRTTQNIKVVSNHVLRTPPYCHAATFLRPSPFSDDMCRSGRQSRANRTARGRASSAADVFCRNTVGRLSCCSAACTDACQPVRCTRLYHRS